MRALLLAAAITLAAGCTDTTDPDGFCIPTDLSVQGCVYAVRRGAIKVYSDPLDAAGQVCQHVQFWGPGSTWIWKCCEGYRCKYHPRDAATPRVVSDLGVD